MQATFTFNGQSYNVGRLQEMNRAELAELYNLIASNLGRKSLGPASTHGKAVERALKALQDYQDWAFEEESVKPTVDVMPEVAKAQELAADKAGTFRLDGEVKIDTTVKDYPAPSKPARKARGFRFVFPAGDEIKEVRPNTNRAVLIEMLGREGGATFEECMAATWGKNEQMDLETQKKTTYEGIRLIHYYVGYGMRQDEKTGKITLFTKPAKK